MSHVVYIGIQNADMFPAVIHNLHRTDYEVVIGDSVKSFSELVNTCAKKCETDLFIFCSHRVRPTDDDIERLIGLLNKGFGYVGLYRFACFGVHRDVFDRIGYFDETYLRGGFEDDDFKLRLQLHNIAFFEDHSVEYISGPSTWITDESYKNSQKIFFEKYNIDHYNYIINVLDKNIKKPEFISKFLPFEQSVLIDQSVTIYGLYNLQTFSLVL